MNDRLLSYIVLEAVHSFLSNTCIKNFMKCQHFPTKKHHTGKSPTAVYAKKKILIKMLCMGKWQKLERFMIFGGVDVNLFVKCQAILEQAQNRQYG